MDNNPLIWVSATETPPQEQERFRKWLYEVYIPLQVQRTDIAGADFYQILNPKAGYPERLGIIYFQNLTDYDNWLKSLVMTDIFKDSKTSFHREFIWAGAFQSTNSFRNDPAVNSDQLTVIIESAPILSFLGFKLSNETADDFDKWLNEWAFKAYIPIIMKLPGIQAANFYTFTGRSAQKETGDPDYPQSLIIFYFENLKAYENFENSPELAVFRKAIKYEFPTGVSVRWNVQYQLVKSFRK